MTAADTNQPKQTWKFPKEFWLVNFMELLERAAYYGFFIVLTLYLTNLAGFDDRWTGVVGGVFFAGLYFLPPFVGAIADRIGFKRGLMLAFALLSIGYFLLGVEHGKVPVLLFLATIMVGGSFIKPLITGTVAKTTDETNRARGYSLFYWVVNIGSFGGKTIVPYVRQGLGLEYVNFFSSGMAFLGLIVVMIFFKDVERDDERKSMRDVVRAFFKILGTPRLMLLTIIVAGFWIIQHQLYATMPKFVIRMVGEHAKPEWLANVNPFVVVVCVVLVTQLMKKRRAVSSMLVGMLLMPFSALAMSLGPWLERMVGKDSVDVIVFAMHPLTVMMIVGIAIQGLAECFISPRFLEYFSLQAPKGEEGTYLGFSHLHSFLSALAGFVMSGFLLDAYCPDPSTLPDNLTAAERASHYAQAHHIWYYFAAIGTTSAIALAIFWVVTNRIDAKREAQSA